MKIGVQLYSARNYLTDNEKIEQAFKRSKELGYDCVQYSGAPDGGNFDPAFLSKMIEKYAMPVVLTHISYDRLDGNLDEEIKKHKAIGCNNIGLGMMPRKYLESKQTLDCFVEWANKVMDKMESEGCKLFYHNHDVEFDKLDLGMPVIDYLYEKLPRLNFTLDTYWVQRGGASVVEYIEKFKGRLECVHLKDMKTVAFSGQQFAPVGEGVINWADVLPAFEKSGAKYALVEQDNAPELGEPFDFLETSIKNIKKYGY